MAGRHDTDFYGWTQEQAALLRRAAELRPNAVPELDWQNLADEIWELGLTLELELYHRYVVLMVHMLKWQYQWRLRSGGWRGTINEQRRRIARLLRKNPAMKPKRLAEFAEAYDDARKQAMDDTGIETFPASCPFTIEQVEDEEFWPESTSPAS
jgi:hypothetical protein